jgi:hypothetical protein
VSETPVAGWATTTSSNPSAIEVSGGSDVTVTFTNTAVGNIIIKKVTNPSGSPQSFTFTPTWGSPFTLTDGEQNDSGPLPVGTYSVVETPVAGWITTTSGGDPANIVVTQNATTTLTFTNTQEGVIIVTKVVVPSTAPQTFTFTPSWGAPFTLANGQSNNSGLLVPGNYSVIETPVPGWTVVTSQDPENIVLGAGQTITIVFTNSGNSNWFRLQRVVVLVGRDPWLPVTGS